MCCNRNFGVKVLIYSEIFLDILNEEGIYSNIESGGRMIKSEQVMEIKLFLLVDELVIKVDVDLESFVE